MRGGGVLVSLLVVIAIIFVASEYFLNLPIAVWSTQSQYAMSAPRQAPGNTDVPRYSNVRGLEDAPRDDVPQGATIDLRRCLETMNLRGLKPEVAQHTCNAIIDGISN